MPVPIFIFQISRKGLALAPEERKERVLLMSIIVLLLAIILVLSITLAFTVFGHTPNSPAVAPTPIIAQPVVTAQASAMAPQASTIDPQVEANNDLDAAQLREEALNSELAILDNYSGLQGAMPMGYMPNMFLSGENINSSDLQQLYSDINCLDGAMDNYTAFCKEYNITPNNAEMQQFYQILDQANSSLPGSTANYNGLIAQWDQQYGQQYGDLPNFNFNST